MLNNLTLEKFFQTVWAWLTGEFLTPNTLMQIAVLAVVLGISSFLHRFAKKRLMNAINKLEASTLTKMVLQKLRRLVMPVSALLLLFFYQMISGLSAVPFTDGIVNAVSNLLFAWIVIRLLVQFIESDPIRNAVTIIVWGIAAMNILGVMDDVSAGLDAVGMDIGEFRLSALSITKGLLALFLLLYMAVFVSKLLERRLRKVKGLTNTSKVLIGKVIRFTLIGIAIVIGVTAAGFDLSLLAVFSGALGLGVGFGLQKGVSNLFSGLLLLLDESIKPGDVLELPNEGTFGWVSHMGARYTEITTRDNKSFLIPNEDFITQQVVNWSHGDTLIRLETNFGVSYKSDPHLVKKLAQEAALQPDRVVDQPKPLCHLIEFGDSSLNFTLRYWIRDAHEGVTNIRGEIMLALWDAFKANGITIPFPHREVFIHDAENLTPVTKAS